jgi:hypothetical protein
MRAIAYHCADVVDRRGRMRRRLHAADREPVKSSPASELDGRLRLIARHCRRRRDAGIAQQGKRIAAPGKRGIITHRPRPVRQKDAVSSDQKSALPRLAMPGPAARNTNRKVGRRRPHQVAGGGEGPQLVAPPRGLHCNCVITSSQAPEDWIEPANETIERAVFGLTT